MGLTKNKRRSTSSRGKPYWSLNSSLGGSTGVEANARSGRSDEITDPSVVVKVTVGSSFDIF
jgi:hypothetical protein